MRIRVVFSGAWLLWTLSACSGSEQAGAGGAAGQAGQGGTAGQGGAGGGAAGTGGSGFVGCDPGQSESCAALAPSFASGTATCRDDRSGFDVSGCVLAERPYNNELVKPAERDPARFADALANNAAPWSFELSLSRQPNDVWVIRLGGGGFCDDHVLSCVDRRFLAQGIEAQDGADFKPKDYDALRQRWVEGPQGATPNDVANPDFWNANFAQFHYKSSDLWLGGSLDAFDTSCRDESCVIDGTGAAACANPTAANGQPCTGRWYRRGRINVRAGVEILIQRFGLDDATAKVLFVGTSAGSYGVLHNADTLAALLPKTAARGDLKVMADGAWAADWDDAGFRMGDQYSKNDQADALALTQSLLNAYQGELLRPCTTAMTAAGRAPSDCILSAESYPFLTKPRSEGGLGLPVFIQKSQYDSLELGFHLDDQERPLFTAKDAVLDKWRSAQFAGLGQTNWLFSGECSYHTTVEVDAWWKVVQPHLGQFWAGAPAQQILGTGTCPPAKCAVDADCNDGKPQTTDVCTVGRCLNFACFVDADCGAAAVCRSGACLPRECYQDGDCDDQNAATLDRCQDYVCQHQ